MPRQYPEKWMDIDLFIAPRPVEPNDDTETVDEDEQELDLPGQSPDYESRTAA